MFTFSVVDGFNDGKLPEGYGQTVLTVTVLLRHRNTYLNQLWNENLAIQGT